MRQVHTFGGEAEVLVEAGAKVVTVQSVAWQTQVAQSRLDSKANRGLASARETLQSVSRLGVQW